MVLQLLQMDCCWLQVLHVGQLCVEESFFEILLLEYKCFSFSTEKFSLFFLSHYWFLFPATAARREPLLAAESRSARPAAAQKPNSESLEHTPDKTTHTVVKVVAQKKSVMLRFTLQFPPMSWSMQPGAFSCCFNWNKRCWPSGFLTLPLFGFQYFCK